MIERLRRDRIAIVLKQPRYPENIGSAARAMCNMGFTRLIVVEPENDDIHKIRKLATHAALEVVNNIQWKQDLISAVGDFSYVVGTTARLGGQRIAVNSPGQLAARLIPIATENRIAIIFGPEDRGLSNEDVRMCHTLLNIPTAGFSSLNLAQAVMIVCHELFQASIEKPASFSPRLASRSELEGMYEQLRDVLIRISYINAQNHEYWVDKTRHFLNRLNLRAREVSIIRGICRQINWYGEKRFKDGLEQASQNNVILERNDSQTTC